MKLTDIFNKKSGPDEARLNLARWYNEVEKFDYMEFNKVLDTFSNHSTTIINYFEERLTNASAESFNAKIKAFRSQLRGVADGNSSCSDWLGYTLKRKLANRENPLTLTHLVKPKVNRPIRRIKKGATFYRNSLILIRRGSGIRTHDPLLPKQTPFY